MDLPWSFAVLVLYPTLQLPALYYLARRYDGDWEPMSEPTGGYDIHPRRAASADDGTCRACGAANADGFTYCRECAARLDPTPG